MYDLQMEMHDDRGIWPEWGGAVRGDMIKPHWAHPGEAMGEVIGPDPVTGERRIYKILRCAWCISIHTWPLPSTEALAAYYSAYFYQHEKPDYIARYEQDQEWWQLCVHAPLLEQAWKLLPEHIEFPRIMEIGAGPGLALDVAREWGWKTYALEPSPVCAQRLKAHGHTTFQTTLEQVPQHQGEWADGVDVLYLYEVLEHQPCPEDFLLRCYDMLAPGGVIVICVPNDCSPIQYAVCRYLKREPYWYAPPQHLHYFSPKMLQLVLRRSGFTIKGMRGSAALELAIFDGQNYLGNETIGRAVHTARMEKELNAVRQGTWRALEAQYRANMAEARLGREIICVAQKPESVW